jgi:hypothetical protein
MFLKCLIKDMQGTRGLPRLNLAYRSRRLLVVFCLQKNRRAGRSCKACIGSFAKYGRFLYHAGLVAELSAPPRAGTQAQRIHCLGSHCPKIPSIMKAIWLIQGLKLQAVALEQVSLCLKNGNRNSCNFIVESLQEIIYIPHEAETTHSADLGNLPGKTQGLK